MIPSLDGFIYAFVRKEALLSLEIEGTQATLVDVLAALVPQAARQSYPFPRGLCAEQQTPCAGDNG